MKNAKDDAMKKQILYQRMKDTCACLYLHTMDAEFAIAAHEVGESGKPLTTGALRALSRGLMEKYYGPEVVLEAESDMESLIIKGLYTPFNYNQYLIFKYYPYTIGMVAAITLAKKVTEGGPADRDAYLNFLKSGGSYYPLENLRAAGVDMETDEPFQTACDTFKSLVDQLDALL